MRWIADETGLVGRCLEWGDLVIVFAEASPVDFSRLSILSSVCRQVNLPFGTRVFYQRNERWFKGSYESSQTTSNALVFDDWNQRMFQLSLDEVHPFSSVLQATPLQALTAGLLDPPEFTSSRLSFLDRYQRVAWSCGPFAALAMAKIDVYSHQIENVLRVLCDSKVRYLLADEVGMGKTIEAGLIAKQVVMSLGVKVLILVPDELREQWKSEMRLRFGLDFPTVTCISFSDFEEFEPGLYGLLIIDEAHQVVASRHGRDAQFYSKIEQLAIGVEMLLLISATPSTNNDEDFLALLHLLDPANYDLSKLSEFRARIARRREIGELVSSLRECQGGVELRSQLTAIEEVFPEDVDLIEHAKRVRELSREASDLPRCLRLAASMAEEISDRYEVDRRVLRASREQVERALRHGRRCPETKVVAEFIEEHLLMHPYEALENWKVGALGWGIETEALSKIYVLFESAIACWPGYLMVLAEARRGAAREDQVFESDLRLLRDTPTYPEEDRYLVSLIEACRACLDQPGDSLTTSAKALLTKLDTTKDGAVVVFASERFVLEEFENRLRAQSTDIQILWRVRGMSADDSAAQVSDFTYGSGKRILFCDRSGQDGLNLERADVAFMLDLPFQPVLVEQRLGRLDRIGRRRPFQVRVLVGVEELGLQAAWFEVLDSGFGIFDDSIASLQFYLDEIVPILRRAAFEGGGQRLLAELASIRSEVVLQRRIIRNDRLLGEMEVEPRISQVSNSLAKCQRNFSKLQNAFESWVRIVWRVTCRKPGEMTPTYRFGTDNLISTNNLNLVRQLGRKTRNGIEITGSFDRGCCARFPGTDLFTCGHSILDLLYRQSLNSDLGTCCAYRRTTNTISVGRATICFKLTVTIAPNIEGTLGDNLKKIVEFLCPAISIQLILKQNGELISDEARKIVVSRPYDSNRDFAVRPENLSSLYQFMNEDALAEVCQKISVELYQTVLSLPEVDSHIRSWRNNMVLRFSRSYRFGRSDMFQEQVLVGLEHPNVSLIALELVFLQGIKT
jgi:ATP-dependent helicase HepA